MRRTFAVAALALSMVGCGTTQKAGTTSTAEKPTVTVTLTTPEPVTPRAPVNPVPILKKIKGCVVKPEVVAGETDIYGNRYAVCNFMDAVDAEGNVMGKGVGTEVEVRTFPGDPRTAVPVDPYRSDDNTKYIIGKDFVVTITNVGKVTGYVELTPSPLADPNKIASEVGGELKPAK
jgi:hypothetical protein